MESCRYSGEGRVAEHSALAKDSCMGPPAAAAEQVVQISAAAKPVAVVQ